MILSATALSDCLVVMIKYPRPGRVKTRLVATLGEENAAALYRCFVQDVLCTVDALNEHALLSIDPWIYRTDFAEWLGSERWFQPQVGPDLGARMDDAFSRAFEAGHDRVVLIGSDLPDLPGSLLVEAFRALDRHDVVLGPARDGGFYLLGWTRRTFRPGLFVAIPWSTSKVLAACRAALLRSGLEPRLLAPWSDVDDEAGLRQLIQRNLLPGDAATRVFLKSSRFPS
ncbi:TIGR04282 family arsenosugar biosynthesis glycosyltransferase [Desulfonatronum sp. SC1]|uniref:TIGR04282 family arsenosugar biosynthesis glycosyltransferase n=1 Tax=Desulfonatronum sp. SC1 TaxID=2109626 RepID=UPI000D317AE7|nr:TIGR04282 family arsenosugar biosynthesis glycosyltransferase [Desulfonatronum sp. SC1]PTN37685.1 glycosyltransferase [Desulfonatronum sp. SC1]